MAIYYRDKAFRKASPGNVGDYHDVDTSALYWISGVKKNREDRHWAGSGAVEIDDDAREEYEQIVGRHAP